MSRKESCQEVFFPFYRGVFSQWHPCRFKVDGIGYNCTEQYMMAQKARVFCDKKSETKIMNARTPAEQKQLGRDVRGFEAKAWNAVARDIVARGNLAKFLEHDDLRSQLIATRGKTLVEASPNDVIWGVGLSENDPRVHDRNQWRGKNWLGQVLTELRDTML